MADRIADLAARCAVALRSAGEFLGCGFLVAPGVVLTCAHVVSGRGPGSITGYWPGGEFIVRSASLIPADHGPGPTYAWPDLALITFDPPLDQPIAWLADRDPAVASAVVCIGYSMHTPATGSAPDSIVLQVAAASGGEFIRVQQGEIPDGVSGSLVLDLDTQRVCGMVKASRDPRAPRGGWIIPVSAIARNLPAIFERNMASHDLNSPWRQLATRRAEFARRLFGSSSPLQVPDPPRNAPPSWWLDPRHKATGFQYRPEMDGLLDWVLDTAQEAPVAKLVVGEGGVGKTRLAVELAMRLAGRGWIAGLLTSDDVWRLEDIAKALPEILADRHHVFLAIDYPEGLAVELTRFFGCLPGPEKGIVRVLLLARFGGWWKAVRPSSDIKYLIDRDPIHLTPLGADPDRSADRFGEALRDYGSGILGTAARLSTPVPTELLHAARRQVSALKLHALALVSVLHARDHGVLPAGQVAWADPLTTLLEHEGKHWREAARGRLSAADDYRFQSRILLTPTLLPAYRDVEAVAGISRIPGLADRYPGESTEIAMLLQAMYPPDRTSSVSWWAALPLDRLGETLLAEVFTDESDGHTAGDYVAAVIGAASTQQAVQGLTVMARLRADPGTSEILATGLSRCLDTLATADRHRLLPALMLADRQVPPGRRSSDRYLARLSAPDALRMVQDLLRPPTHRPLLETGLAMLDHAERLLDSDEIRTANLPEWMRKIFLDLRALGIDPPAETVAHILAGALRAQLLLQLGRAGEAIGPAEDAANSMRAVLRVSGSTEGARENGGAEVPRLLMGRDRIVYASGSSDVSEYLLFVLDIYAKTLATVGRLQDSAQVRQECAAVAERNAAMKGFEEAIGLLRPLLKDDRWRTASFLSTTLGLFSETARKHGDGEPAVAAAREAIRLDVTRTDDLRPTPTEELARHRRMLFLALAKLMGERAEQGVGTAVILAIAIEICQLARSFPSEELDDGAVAIFTSTLATIGRILRDAGRAEEALAPLDEAIEILRHRADSHSAGESASRLFAIGATRISLFKVLRRHAEAARAMAQYLADFRRPVTSRVDERINCMLMATDIIDSLPRPEFAVQALELAVEISRTCHDWAARFPDGLPGVAASVLVLFKILREMVQGGMTAGWQRPAILEIADGVELLLEQVPDLLETGHAHALAFGAGLLAGGDTTDSQDLDRALEMTIRASKVSQALAAHGKSAHMMPEADSEGVRQIAETVSLVTQGTLLSAKHRYQDATQPLEQALGILLTTGQGISADQARLLNMTLSLLYEAYTILKRDDARRSMIDALHASQVPESVTDERLAGTERPGDLLNALRAAEELVASDPEEAVAALQGILDAAAGRQREIAYAACRKMADALRKIGRWQEALRIANLQIGYGRAAGLGPWTRLYDRCKLLETRLQTGAGDQEILSEAASLIAEAERLPGEAAGREYADPGWIRELLQRISAMAALRLGQWPEALQFVQAEVKLLRDRGASASELAGAEFNAYSALAALDRTSEASELLNRCATGFRNDSREAGPGLVIQARGELAALADDHVSAVRLQSEALELLYRSGDSVKIHEAHAVMGMRLRDADQFSASALAHHLTAAVLAEFLGQPADTHAITGGLFLRAGEYPMTADLLCAAVGEQHSAHLSELLESLSENTSTGPDVVLTRVIARAREGRKATFDEFARHRMEWDPVFAGIAVARHGNVATARAVQARLLLYSGDRSWSQFSTALAHVLHGRREATRDMALDTVDRILLRRCLDVLDGSVYIPLALADAMPICGFLSTFLQAAMNNEPTTELGRGLEELAGIERWHPLVEPLKGILAGSRNLKMISGLDSGNKLIISTLLRNLDVPGA